MIKGPKKLLSEGITAVLDEFFEVDPDQIEANLLGDTQIVLRSTKLRPRAIELFQSDEQTVTSFTTGIVEQALFTWKWTSLGKQYLVKDACLSIRGLKFKSELSNDSAERREGFVRTDTGRLVPSDDKPKRRRSSLAEIKQEGLLESYIRHQVDHIIDALTLAVEDFEFRLELPPNELGEVSGITASGNTVELRSIGRQLGGEDHLRHRASFVNGGLRQQLSFGSIRFGTFKSRESGDGPRTTTEFPLLDPLSYQLLATRYTGERFSGVSSGLKVVGMPVSSSHDIEEMDILVHAGLEQIGVLVDLGNLILQKKSSEDEADAQVPMSRNNVLLSRDGNLTREEVKCKRLDPLIEEEEKGKEESAAAGVEASISGDIWFPSLTEEELRTIEQIDCYGSIAGVNDEVNNDDDKVDMYETLKLDVTKGSIFQIPVTGVSVILPNDAKLTLEALCVNYRADGTVMNFEGDYGGGILIDGFQLVRTNCGGDGFAKSRWVVDLITSRFTIEEETGSEYPTNSKVAQIQWTEEKMNLLVGGWVKILEMISALKLEKHPEHIFGGAVNNGFSVSFGV